MFKDTGQSGMVTIFATDDAVRAEMARTLLLGAGIFHLVQKGADYGAAQLGMEQMMGPASIQILVKPAEVKKAREVLSKEFDLDKEG